MRRIHLLFASIVLLAASTVRADKLSDFKDAVGRDGCESIPYSDLKGTCKDQQSYVHDYCDGGKGPVSCGSPAITRQLKDTLDKEQRNYQSLRDQRSNAKDDNEKARLDKEIYEAGKRVDQAAADIETRRKLVNDATYNINKCMDYRRAVMNVFASAQDNARGENDPAIQPLARQLRDKWEAEKRGHEIQIKDRDNALSACKDSVP